MQSAQSHIQASYFKPNLNGKRYLVRILHTHENTGRDLHTQRPSKGTDYDLVRGMPQRRGRGASGMDVKRQMPPVVSLL